MNNAQLKYARERLAQAKRDRQNALGYAHGFTADQRDALYEEGMFSVRKASAGNYVIDWLGEDEYKARRKAAWDKIDVEYQKVLDQLMLGDDAAALEMINKFIGE